MIRKDRATAKRKVTRSRALLPSGTTNHPDLQIAAAAQSQTGGPSPSCAEMQTLTALFIMALAPLVAGFGAFTEDPANANKHIPGCISAQEHVPKEPTAWSSHPEAPGLGAAFGWG